VRLLAGDGGKEMLGVKPFNEALSMAKDLQVDLVLLNPEANPPLCRLVDWSK
jgi:translation initiation factor IF-3